MRTAGSYRLSLVVALAGAIGAIGGDILSAGGETQNVNRITASRDGHLSGNAVPQAAVRPEGIATVSRRDLEFERVRVVAQAAGSVRVIVQLEVPNLKALTAMSHAAKAPAPIAAADGQLSAAIAGVRQLELAKLAGTPHKLNRTYSSVPFVAMTISEQALDVLRASPGIVGINEDRVAAPLLDNTVNITGASTAWSSGFDGTGWYVAILDTGIRASHDFFAGKNIVQACFSSGSDGLGDCPNGTPTDTTSPDAARHLPGDGGVYHGTHVAGIATGNDPTRAGGPLYGVARGADIIAIQVFSDFPTGQGSIDSDRIAAQDYLYSIRTTYNIASANMSLGGGDYSDQATCDAASAGEKAAIDNLRSAGIAMAVATGNGARCTSISAPGCISSVIGVGNTEDSDVEAFDSDYHPTLMDIFAPGSSVLSAVGSSDSAYNGSYSGTSMATPHVAGAYAILKQANPGATVQEIFDALHATGDPVSGRCVPTPTQRRIQIDLALEALNAGDLKFSQPPDNTGEAMASDVDLTDMSPNSVRADDFISDGRAISGVRWWGSNLSTGSPAAAAAQAQVSDRRESARSETSASIPVYTESELADMVAEKARRAANRPTPAAPSLVPTLKGVGTDDPIDEPLVGGDTCGTATVISAVPYSDSGNTCAFADNYNEVCPFTNTGGRDVAYRFTPASNMVVDISLCTNSAYDTKVYVYQGSCPGTDVACNDDSCSTPSFPNPWVSSLSNVSLTGGLTYYIIVDGYSATDCGNYTLDMTLYVPCDVTCDAGATPENEPACGLPSDAFNGGCNSTPPVFTPITCGDTFCGTGAFDGSNRDTDWYKLVLGAPQPVTWTVRAEFQALVGIIETGGVDACPAPGFRMSTVLPRCTTGSVSDVLPAGTWYLFVAPDFAANVICGAEYNAALTCGAPIVCGNGLVEPTEDCDPPDGTTCNATCHFVTCGDGVVEGLEQCDPPTDLTCDSNCQLVPNPPIDGWLVSFHEPLAKGGSLAEPLGLYFCEAAVVAVRATPFTSCDTRQVRQYFASLAECCLLMANADTRSSNVPAQADGFHEETCFEYDIDIQAVMGYTYSLGGGCAQTPTANAATIPFWGWHTTGVSLGAHLALESTLTTSPPDFLYGPWANFTPTCSAQNMAFQLMTQESGDTDCDANGVPDACESQPDCQPNGVFDECDIAAGVSEDCQPNGVPDDCDIRDCAPNDLACQDCQPDGIPDSCQLTNNDANENGRPDECDPASPQISCLPDKNRSLGLILAGTGGATGPVYQVDDGSAEDSIGVGDGAGGGTTFGWANRFRNNTGAPIVLAEIDVAFGNPLGGGTGVSPGDAVDAVIWIDAAATGNLLNAVKKHRWTLPGGVHADDGSFATHAVPCGGITIPTGADFYVGCGDIQTSIDSLARFPAAIDQGLSAGRSWAFFHPTQNVFNPDNFAGQNVDTIDGFGLPGNWLIRVRTAGAPLAAATAGPGATTALRVNLVELQNPVPANLPQYPPPQFGCWEAGAACGTVIPAAPPVAACTGTDEAVPPNAQAQGGCARWVGKPGNFLEAQDVPLGASTRTARLQCTPYYQDWTTEGVFFVTGAEISPSSKYDVQAYDASCAGMEGSCLDVSPALRLTTARSGDVQTPFNPPSTTTQPDALDVATVVNKLKNLPGAPLKAVTQLQPNLTELNADVNALDIVAVVDAVKQRAYAFSGPCPCPSLVTCGTTGCATAAICASTYGAGATCVKTCSGGGPNDGLPCINNTHCPSGTCGAGFCRDACGRCSP